MSGQRKVQDTNFLWHVPVPAVSLPERDRDLAFTTDPGRLEQVESLIRNTDVLERDCGPLGTPRVWHFNTGVRTWVASVTNPGVPIFDPFRFDKEVDVEPPGGDPDGRRELVFPVGRNTVNWKAGSMISFLDKWFFYIPLGVPGWKDVKLLKFTADFFTWGLPVVGLFVNTDLVGQTVVDLEQRVDVWDRVPPEITTAPEAFQFEGTIIGGASIRTEQYRQQLLDALEYSDLCGTKLELVEPLPLLWPVDQTTPVTWTVLDPGPNPDSPRADLRNASSVTQMVTVVDTIAPAIRPPEGVVLEVPGDETSPVEVALLPPPIFDFVDARPTVQNDAPSDFLFPLGLTEVTWTVSDQSGNTSQATQRVNIKAEGTNTAPTAASQSGDDGLSVQSFTPIPIVISGSDADSDPLSLRISDPPENGFFQAPLLPYFFGDVRVESIESTQCGRDPDTLFDPTYVTVSDDGLTYVMNAVVDCASFDFPNTGTRITVLYEDNEVVAARDLPKSGDFFSALNVDTQRGFIVYTSTFAEYGVLKLDLRTLETLAEYKLPDGVSPKKAAFDFRDGREVLYSTLPAGATSPVNLGGYDVFDLSSLEPGQTRYELDESHRAGRVLIGEDAAPGVTNAPPADGVLLRVDIAGSVSDVELVSPAGVSCEQDPGEEVYGFVCNLPTMLGNDIEVEVEGFVDIDEGVQRIRAVATSRHPDPQGIAAAYQEVQPVAPTLARTAALGGESDGGSALVQVAGQTLSVGLTVGTTAEEAAAVADAINDDALLASAGVTAQANGAALEVSEPLESLRFTAGRLDRGIPVPFVDGRLTLDLDLLGVFRSAPASGTAFVTRDRTIVLSADAIGPIDATAQASGPPEIAEVRVIDARAGGGALGGEGDFDLPLSGAIQLVTDGAPPYPELSLAAIGSATETSAPLSSTVDIWLAGTPWSTEAFDIDAWLAAEGTTATFTFEGEDQRDFAGVEGRLKVVTPVPLEIYVDDSLAEVIAGAAELSPKLVPEPDPGLLALAALLTCAGVRGWRRGSAPAARRR